MSSQKHWHPEEGRDIFHKLNGLLKLRSENDMELPVKEMEKGGFRIETESSGCNLADFDHFKSEILADLTRVNCKDLEDMVYRMELFYDKIVVIIDMKYIAGSTIG